MRIIGVRKQLCFKTEMGVETMGSHEGRGREGGQKGKEHRGEEIGYTSI